MKTHGFAYLFGGLILFLSFKLAAMGWALPFEANDSSEENIIKYALSAIADGSESHIGNIFIGPALLKYGNNDSFFKLHTDLGLKNPVRFTDLKISTEKLNYSGPSFLNEPASKARTYQSFTVSGWNAQDPFTTLNGKIECASYWTTSGLVMNQVIKEHTYCRIFAFEIQ